MNLGSASLKTISKPASTGGADWHADLAQPRELAFAQFLKRKMSGPVSPKGEISVPPCTCPQLLVAFLQIIQASCCARWGVRGAPALQPTEPLIVESWTLVFHTIWRGLPMWSLMFGFVVSLHRVQKPVWAAWPQPLLPYLKQAYPACFSNKLKMQGCWSTLILTLILVYDLTKGSSRGF